MSVSERRNRKSNKWGSRAYTYRVAGPRYRTRPRKGAFWQRPARRSGTVGVSAAFDWIGEGHAQRLHLHCPERAVQGRVPTGRHSVLRRLEEVYALRLDVQAVPGVLPGGPQGNARYPRRLRQRTIRDELNGQTRIPQVPRPRSCGYGRANKGVLVSWRDLEAAPESCFRSGNPTHGLRG